MNERSIWYSALADILAIIHIPGMLSRLPTMSTEALRERAIRMWRVDQCWYQGPLRPTIIQRYRCDTNVTRVHFMPGGDWVIMTLVNGSIHLCAANDISTPQFVIPAGTGARGDLGMSHSPHLGTLIHLMEARWQIGWAHIS